VTFGARTFYGDPVKGVFLPEPRTKFAIALQPEPTYCPNPMATPAETSCALTNPGCVQFCKRSHDGPVRALRSQPLDSRSQRILAREEKPDSVQTTDGHAPRRAHRVERSASPILW
jgi:hypothetical protein